MAILLTGGTGYIGIHTAVELLNAGYEVIILDNLMNSGPNALDGLREITGKQPLFIKVDLRDYEELEKVFKVYDFEMVIHFAGLKAVGESVEKPLEYYHNNVAGTINLLKIMEQYDIRKLVFSSSATVYGIPIQIPLTESSPLNAINPYGRTKLMIEEILYDLYFSNKNWSIAVLRYFNPVGAHPSGKIGENPRGIPNNLVPYITQVATGELKELKIFGSDYSTPDGTCIRDYIHVVDLADGHLKAMEKLKLASGVYYYNLGTGKGHSVLEMVKAFEASTGKKIPYTFVERRPGDAEVCVADPSKTNKELGWVAQRTILDMCRDAWRWQLNSM